MAELGHSVLRKERPRAEVLRLRLSQLESRLRDAARESREAGYFQLSAVVADCIEQVQGLLHGSELPETLSVATAIARAERTLDVWRGLRTF